MKYQQTYDELMAHLKEQVQFLLRSAKAYDNGFSSEAKRLAVIIRILLHDTPRSTSLLTQLNKKNLLFYDICIDIDCDPINLLSWNGLIGMKIVENHLIKYAPLLDGVVPQSILKRNVSFDEWWNKIVIVDYHRNTLTRKDLILSVSNKDGGAHVDPELEKPYADLTRGNSLGWNVVIDGQVMPLLNRPEMASVRQICHELLKSLNDEFPELFE